MGEDLEDVPLPQLFFQAQQLHGSANSSRIGNDDVKKACQILQKCQEIVDKLGLFSRNEDKDDISTGDLKYLLVPYYLGDLTEKLETEDRIQLIRVSNEQLLNFIRSCERLELLSASETEVLTREGQTTPETRRAEKVARFRKQRAAESKLQEIRERKERRRRSMQATAKTTSVEQGEENLPDDDEEEEREAWFMQISLSLCKSLDLVEMLQREEEMLASVQAANEEGRESFSKEVLDERHQRADDWHRQGAVKAQTSRPAVPINCATYAQDVIEGRVAIQPSHQHTHGSPMLFGPASVVSGSLSSDRERQIAQVFQPSHSLPSMSIEQAGLAEMEIMRTWNEKNQKIFDEARQSSWVGEEKNPDDSDDEAATDKARAWDDWKDDNPRGAGNKKLTPCG